MFSISLLCLTAKCGTGRDVINSKGKKAGDSTLDSTRGREEQEEATHDASNFRHSYVELQKVLGSMERYGTLLH